MTRNVVIAGGGTAGWMTAAYLKVAFGQRLDVTLVESKNVGTIGVGEATFSTVRHFFDYLGLAEHEWMPQCNATYKLGIKFEGWRHPGHSFYHPFERLRTAQGFTLADWWLKNGTDGPNGAAFDRSCLVLPALCDARRAPKYFDGSLFDPQLHDGGERQRETTLSDQDTQFPYAYHFDAGLLADYLARFCVERGVRHILDDIVEVRQDEYGYIESLLTGEHGDVRGDLFIDCTGFRAMLIGKLLNTPFVSYQDVLPNNRAVAMRVPVDIERDGIPPYTTAAAQEAGWIWKIPLYGRLGIGYVYSDDYCTPEEAERTLRHAAGPAAEELEAMHIRMRIGRHRDSWVKNCVAIGLASGFVEPLESTGIFFIQHGVEQLVQHFPGENFDEGLIAAYNRRVAQCLDGVREFLTLHYRCAARTDTPYWKDAKARDLPDGMEERLRLWSVHLPDEETLYPYYHGFESYSYKVMLLGLGYYPKGHRPALDMVDGHEAQREFANIRRQAEQLATELPSHYDYFTEMRRRSGAAPQA